MIGVFKAERVGSFACVVLARVEAVVLQDEVPKDRASIITQFTLVGLQ